MKNVITAIGNPNLNNELVETQKYNIISKDIQYQDGIIEILEKNNEIDFLIMSNSILGDLDFNYFISRIKKINEKIKIIVFLNKENEDIINFLNSKKIYDIFLEKELRLDLIEKLIDETNIKREISDLKEIILKNENNKYDLIKNNNNYINKNGKIICITGNYGVREKYFFY